MGNCVIKDKTMYLWNFNGDMNLYSKIMRNMNILIFLNESCRQLSVLDKQKPIVLTRELRYLTFEWDFNYRIDLSKKITCVVFGYRFDLKMISRGTCRNAQIVNAPNGCVCDANNLTVLRILESIKKS